MSHYQQYLKAVQPKDGTPSAASSITRKSINKSYTPTSPTSFGASPAQPPLPMGRIKSGTDSSVPVSSTSAPPTPASTASSEVQSRSSYPSPSVTNSSPLSSTAQPTTPSSLAKSKIDNALHIALTLQIEATTHHSKRPFSAVLLGPDKSTVLLTHFSISHVRHAESELARLASDHFSISYLADCTLVSTWEPCAMCSGTIYWSGIGRVIYAASEEKLKDLTGADNEENMTMSLPCRTVLESGQRQVEVIGPVPVWEEKVVEESGKWWKEHKGKAASIRENGSIKNGLDHAQGDRGSVVTTWTGEESVLSSIGEDGEYTADLNIDWMR